jgi:hypothetical protein
MAKARGIIARTRPGTNPAAALPGATVAVTGASVDVAEPLVSAVAVAVLVCVDVLSSFSAFSYRSTTKSTTSLPYFSK